MVRRTAVPGGASGDGVRDATRLRAGRVAFTGSRDPTINPWCAKQMSPPIPLRRGCAAAAV